jgi:hypothetical protein
MNQDEMKHLIDTFNCVEDCPIFADMFEFCKMYAGASLAGARNSQREQRTQRSTGLEAFITPSAAKPMDFAT